MYTRFQLAKKYLQYRVVSSNGKGHGTHSPFVYDFITKVLRDKKKYDCYEKIEKLRGQLLADNSKIEVEDFGAGSTIIKTKERIVKDIARSSLKPRKYAQLLYRMVNYCQPETVLELGTSLGITTAYLASGNKKGQVYTGEGSATIASIARKNFAQLELTNIELVEGDFSVTLPQLFSKIGQVNFAFVDGNHRKEPTLQYFDSLLKYATGSALLVFDDIHWSKEMEEAWDIIISHPSVTLSIDLFFIGIIGINPDIKVKQHFTIAY